MLPKLIIIVGPTAVGKTALSIELAKRLNTEIISGDSVQVYRKLDIGSAKPTLEERQGVKHHMIDILDPDQEFSVAMFQAMVEPLIKDLNNQGKIPILAGGTGLYVKSITDNLTFTDFDVDWEFREQMQTLAAEIGPEGLWHKLQLIDPSTAERVHPNDLKRIIRALEVFQHTGKPMSEYQTLSAYNPAKFNLIMYGLTMNRAKLYERINRRVDLMVEAGFVGEVKNLLEQGYDLRNPAMGSLGYKELIQYLQGQIGYETALELIKRNTRRFAKRQLIWFRKEHRINWLDVEKHQSIHELADEITSTVAGQFGLV